MTTKTDKSKAKTNGNGSMSPHRRDALARLGEQIEKMGRTSEVLKVRMVNNSTFEITGTDDQGKVTRTFEDKGLWQ